MAERKKYPEVHRNCRDIGGVGPITAYNKVIRGGNPGGNGKAKLEGLGISKEISFTTTTTKDANAIPLWRDGINKIGTYKTHKPVFNDFLCIELHTYSDDQGNKYSEHQAIFKLVNQTIRWVNSGNGVYCHCDAGKDRTGKFFVVLEAILGVTRQDLVVDFWDESVASGCKPADGKGACDKYCDRFGGKGLDGVELQKAVIKNAISNGCSEQDINNFIAIMTQGAPPSGVSGGDSTGVSGTVIAGTSMPQPNAPRPIMGSRGENTVYRLSDSERVRDKAFNIYDSRKKKITSLGEQLSKTVPELGRDIILTSEAYGSEILKGGQNSKTGRGLNKK